MSTPPYYKIKFNIPVASRCIWDMVCCARRLPGQFHGGLKKALPIFQKVFISPLGRWIGPFSSMVFTPLGTLLTPSSTDSYYSCHPDRATTSVQSHCRWHFQYLALRMNYSWLILATCKLEVMKLKFLSSFLNPDDSTESCILIYCITNLTSSNQIIHWDSEYPTDHFPNENNPHITNAFFGVYS